MGVSIRKQIIEKKELSGIYFPTIILHLIHDLLPARILSRHSQKGFWNDPKAFLSGYINIFQTAVKKFLYEISYFQPSVLQTSLVRVFTLTLKKCFIYQLWERSSLIKFVCKLFALRTFFSYVFLLFFLTDPRL